MRKQVHLPAKFCKPLWKSAVIFSIMVLIYKEEGKSMEQQTTTKRIWEIDFLRGLLIPGMILIHLVYDVTVLYRLADWRWPWWYVLLQYNYGALFVALSGVSVTLGSRCVRRGLTVLAWGMVCTAVTAGMYLLGMADRGVLIYFGVLHCIGVCMLLWPVFRRCPVWGLALIGLAMAVAGQYLRYQTFDMPYLVVLGFQFPGFSSSDYYPLLPNLGYFLLGAAVGRVLYRNKHSLLDHVDQTRYPIRVLTCWGRHSLMIYLLHQPVLALVCQGIVWIRKL